MGAEGEQGREVRSKEKKSGREKKIIRANIDFKYTGHWLHRH